MHDFAGKVAVVTGGASGIGLAMARRFGAVGMAVAIADIEEEPLEAAASALFSEGIDVLAMHTDVSSVTIMYPPALTQFVSDVLRSPLRGDGDSNVLQHSGFEFKLVPNMWLQIGLGGQTGYGGGTNPDGFIMYVNDGKALIRQEQQSLAVTSKAAGSDFEHDNLGAHEYGIHTVRAVGYGSWQSAVRAVTN